MNIAEENPGTIDHFIFKSLIPDTVTFSRDHVTIVGRLTVEKHGWSSPGVPFTVMADWGIATFQIYRSQMTLEFSPPMGQGMTWIIKGRTLMYK